MNVIIFPVLKASKSFFYSALKASTSFLYSALKASASSLSVGTSGGDDH